MNTAFLSGRVSDVEPGTLPDGQTSYLNFRLTEEAERGDTASFVQISAYRDMADQAMPWLVNGVRVVVGGNLRSERDGRYLIIVARQIAAYTDGAGR